MLLHMTSMELKFCNCLMEHMLQYHFHDREEMASALDLKPTEMNPSDLAAWIFKYFAVRQIPLDSVIMQMAQ